MKLTTTTQVSVDGVMQGPGAPVASVAERGAFERSGWAHFDNEAGSVMDEIFRRADAFVFGRRTYEIFAGSWGTWDDPGDSPIWTALNTLPKYVALTTPFDPTWAKVSCILVNVWLGFPYWFLVCTGALQAVPEELTEAARVDGAGGLQVFRKVTLPLLLVATAPLLIASFAFNFNNFNNIYFLTGGGPYQVEQTVAGSTDILISYTYKIAFQAGSGAQYGLAAAVSIFIFFIVAGISAISPFRAPSMPSSRRASTGLSRRADSCSRRLRSSARRSRSRRQPPCPDRSLRRSSRLFAT